MTIGQISQSIGIMITTKISLQKMSLQVLVRLFRGNAIYAGIVGRRKTIEGVNVLFVKEKNTLH